MDYKKAQTKSMKVFGVFLLLVLGVVFVMAGTVFTPISTPTGTTENSSFVAEWNFTEANLKELKWAFNGTNNSIIDNSIVMSCNMDNRSQLGEDNSKIVCWSPNGGLNGTVSTVTPTNLGKVNGAYDFNANGNINFGNPEELNFGNDDFTISLWFNARDTITKTNLFAKYANGYDMYMEANGSLKFELYNVTSHPIITTPIGYILSDTWYHVTAIRNSTEISMYINGDYYGKTSTPLAINVSDTPNFRIGSNSAGTGQRFNGTIDEFIVYNKSLNSDEIKILYNSQLTKYDSDNWSFLINETGLTANATGVPYDYFVCSTNSTDYETCSELNTISAVLPVTVITANFSNSLGEINPSFYGAVVSDYGGIFKTDEDAWNNANLKYSRIDSYLNLYYSNTSNPSGINFTGDISNYTSYIKNAYSNGNRILLIESYMPTWLADNSSGKCNNLIYCPPTNFTIYANIMVDFIDRITEGNTTLQSIIDVEVWNEPDDVYFFMNLLPYQDANKYSNYSMIYNTSYNAIKSYNPTIQVGGPASTHIGDLYGYNFLDWFLDDYSDQMDFISFHSYEVPSQYDNYYEAFDDQMTKLLAHCDTYSANCSRIIIGEWNYNGGEIASSSSEEYKKIIASGYLYGLNNYPENLNLMLYYFLHPTDSYAMIKGTSLTTSYNVTKSFANNHPDGATVYTSSSSDGTILTTSTVKDVFYAITVINTDTEAKNITVDTDYTITKLYNLETGEEFSSTNGTFNIGVMDSFDILYLGYNGTITGLVCRMDLDENSGLVSHDLSGNSNNGVLSSGADWNNDGILVTLTNLVDYTLSGNLFTIINDEHYWSELQTIYDYNKNAQSSNYNSMRTLITGLAGFSNWISLIVIVIAAAIVLGVVLLNFNNGKNGI